MPFMRNTSVIVSGLPRAGTSMLMRMLAAGGMPLLTGEHRTADADNPHGYFEYAPVKRLRDDASWLPEARGKAVKVISFLLPHLPPDEDYRLIYLRRAIPEVVASQRIMLERQGIDPGDDPRTAALLEKHVRHMEAWIPAQGHFACLMLEHRAVIEKPQHAAAVINDFLGRGLDVASMTAAVDPALHRNHY
ncbi:MAG: sulfotransferase family protein [Candidatus Hydrogenedentota bacterium]